MTARHATCNMQHATCNMQHATCAVHAVPRRTRHTALLLLLLLLHASSPPTRARHVTGVQRSGVLEGRCCRQKENRRAGLRLSQQTRSRWRRVRTMPDPGAAQWRQQPAVVAGWSEVDGRTGKQDSTMRGDTTRCDAMRCERWTNRQSDVGRCRPGPWRQAAGSEGVGRGVVGRWR